MATAVYNPLTNTVQTFVRDDYGSYRPESPWILMPESELPPGWTYTPDVPTDGIAELHAIAVALLDSRIDAQYASLMTILRSMGLVIRARTEGDIVPALNNVIQWIIDRGLGTVAQRTTLNGYKLNPVSVADFRTAIVNRINSGNGDGALS